MIARNFNIVKFVLVFNRKADSPLIVDPNAMLSFPVTLQFLQMIGRRYTGSNQNSTAQTSSDVPKEITVDGKTLIKDSTKATQMYLDAYSGGTVTLDASKLTYINYADTQTLYYQFTKSEVMDSSSITDLESHLVAVETY